MVAPAPPTPIPSATWTRRHTLLALLIVAAIVAVGIVVPHYVDYTNGSHPSRVTLWMWLFVAALLALFIVVAGDGITGLKRGAFIDDRNRMSLARLQLILWTTLILSAFLAAGLANVGTSQSNPLAIHIPEQLWLAMGISTASLVGSSLILSTKKGQRADPDAALPTLALLDAQGVNPGSVAAQGSVLTYLSPADSRWSDLFQGDEITNGGHLDLTKIQMFFFTIILVVAYGSALGDLFVHTTTRIGDFPGLDNGFVTLLAISHAGYLGKKAVPQTPTV